MNKKKVFIIGYVWVEPNSSAAGSRMLQLIELFLHLGYKVIFGSPAQKTMHKFDLTSLGVEEVSIALNHESFNVYIKNLQPEIVLFDRFMMEEQFGWRVSENSPKSLRILDTEDLHFLRKTREEALKKNTPFQKDMLLKSDLAKREIASIYRCDLSLIISSFEMDLLQDFFKIDNSILYHLPFLLNFFSTFDKQGISPFEKRHNFMFIGNFLHRPNVDAVLLLKERCWKSIKEQLPEAELHIYGAYETQQIKQLHNPQEGFLIKGYASSSSEIFQKAKVLLAPLRYGAGIKGKLTEAMENGTPSITTSIGAEGMHGALPWNGAIADDLDLFVREAVALYTDRVKWQIAQENGFDIINTLYSKDVLTASFSNNLNVLLENIEEHRNKNFMGSLLQYHSLKRTKYMSKWIEEKNKL